MLAVFCVRVHDTSQGGEEGGSFRSCISAMRALDLAVVTYGESEWEFGQCKRDDVA